MHEGPLGWKEPLGWLTRARAAPIAGNRKRAFPCSAHTRLPAHARGSARLHRSALAAPGPREVSSSRVVPVLRNSSWTTGVVPECRCSRHADGSAAAPLNTLSWDAMSAAHCAGVLVTNGSARATGRAYPFGLPRSSPVNFTEFPRAHAIINTRPPWRSHCAVARRRSPSRPTRRVTPASASHTAHTTPLAAAVPAST
jgi:hypothetical protein